MNNRRVSALLVPNQQSIFQVPASHPCDCFDPTNNLGIYFVDVLAGLLFMSQSHFCQLGTCGCRLIMESQSLWVYWSRLVSRPAIQTCHCNLPCACSWHWRSARIDGGSSGGCKEANWLSSASIGPALHTSLNEFDFIHHGAQFGFYAAFATS